MNNQYFVTGSLTLARTMKFLGFEYYMFADENSGTRYTFKNTNEFQSAYKDVCELKNKYKK